RADPRRSNAPIQNPLRRHTRRRSLTPTTKHNGFTRPQNLTQASFCSMAVTQRFGYVSGLQKRI
ncbi:hypothetical protein, partial [Corynebacterium coyleae]|uniref:hypothetical protein n=1 Tax=Corynebacterium coyleae TaxID=53374 RepID=UPI001ADCDAB4